MLVYLESLGCARNQVDSETMLAQLASAGWRVTHDPAAAHVIVVNTCSFIESAADESIDTILELSAYKRKGRCRRLIVTGCLPERYGRETARSLPEVDLFLGTGAYDQIVAAVQGDIAPGRCLLPDPDTIPTQRPQLRRPFSPAAAYLKIAEGCDRHCTYCIIPKLRGRQKSRPLETLLAEARALIGTGIRELTLVAQETTAYGQDLTSDENLARLLEQLARLDQAVWIRFLYGHPQSMSPAVMKIIAQHDNLCPYFDIPIQHASARVLRRMGRAYTDQDLVRLFDRIRTAIPDAALRTTVLVGFPGESDQDFRKLVDFIEHVRFDHLGAFVYSDAEDLAAHSLSGHVGPRVAHQRLDHLMAIQQGISARSLEKFMDQRLEVLVERICKDDQAEGRSSYQAPEVDGSTLIRGSGVHALTVGSIIPVHIVQTLDYDLIGEVA